MKREISCKLSGDDVLQTTSVYDDKGSLDSENTVALGNRDIVLAQIEEQLSEAKRDLEGASSPLASKPAPAGDGAPGVALAFFLQGSTLYKVETRRNSAGKLSSESTSKLGHLAGILENYKARHAEIRALRDAIASAK